MTIGSIFTQTFWQPSWTLDKLPSLAGKVAIVTGASAGLGVITVRELARKGAHVFAVGRSSEKTLPIIDEIKKTTGNDKVEFLQADLLDLVSVEAAADAFLKRKLPLDILVNNAGIMYSPWSLSKQGIESQFATNHFAHVVFTVKLLPALKRAPTARIVNVSSLGHQFIWNGINYDNLNVESSYDMYVRYSETKLANIHFTRELQTRLDAAGVKSIRVNALHPGAVKTELGRHLTGTMNFIVGTLQSIFINAEKGALTQIYVAADPDIERHDYRGRYFVPFAALAEPTAIATSEQHTVKTWEWTQEMLKKQFRNTWSWSEAGL